MATRKATASVGVSNGDRSATMKLRERPAAPPPSTPPQVARDMAGKLTPVRILLSYWYCKDMDMEATLGRYFGEPPWPEIFCDSGAFSAMTQGVRINVHQYAAWLLKWKHLFHVYANLDVIKNAPKTWENQRVLEEQYGLTPLPVFHVLEPWEYLERALERYPYIALGVAGSNSATYMRWLVRCFRLNSEAGNPSVFHGFGITNWDALMAFPWYTVDSTSWNQAPRFGNVPVWDRTRGGFLKVQTGDHKRAHALAGHLRHLGFSPSALADRERDTHLRARCCVLSALAYKQAEAWLRRRHGLVLPQAGPFVETGPGLKIYLADGSMTNLGDANAGLKYYAAPLAGSNWPAPPQRLAYLYGTT